MKKYILPLILILCLAFSLSVYSADLYSTYDQRIKLTVSNTNIDAELTWFPVTVFLTSTAGEEVFAEFDADADFDRVAFTTSDGSTQVYADCELFDDSEQKAIYHIAKTGVAISNTGTTDFYMYYDNDAAHNTSYISKSGGTAAQSVWDGNFEAVYHMNDGASTSAIYDSTSNNNDGTKKDANEPQQITTGQVGQGQDFDGGVADIITVGDHSDLDMGSGNFTVEAVVKAETLNTDDDTGIVCKYAVGGTTTPSYILNTFHKQIRWRIRDAEGDAIDIQQQEVMSTGTWYYLAGRRTAIDTAYLQINDNSYDDTVANVGSCDNDEDLYIGRFYITNAFNGIIDEIRISDKDRGSAWIKATYNSLWDSLLTYGSEETGGVTYNSIFFGCNF